MAGTLQVHPFVKTYDELQRSIKRLKSYKEMSKAFLSETDIDHLDLIISKLNECVNLIPEKFQVTRYKYTKED